MMKRFLATLCLFSILFLFLFTTPALAATANPGTLPGGGGSWVFNDFPSGAEASVTKGDFNGTGYGIFNLFTYLQAGILGIIGCLPPITCRAGQSQTYIQQINQISFVSDVNQSVAMIYKSPPADTGLFLADLGQTLGFMPKKAYAQGIGFSGLSALLPIWKAFRNISYFLLAAVLVIIGFMVMFRKHIDPKTVVTVQNSLPRIVVALVLITFSYAILGILIDAMYLIIALAASLLVPVSNGALTSSTGNDFLGGGLGTVTGTLIQGWWESIGRVVDLIFFDVPILSGLRQLPFGIGALFSGGLNVIFGFVLAIMVLFSYVKIFIKLLTAYIQVIISLFVGPLQILLDAFPGGNGFGPWLNNLIATLSIFPVTAIMFMIGRILTSSTASTIWTPPMLSSGSGAPGAGVAALLGLGILMTAPNVADTIKEALKTKSPLAIGPAAITGPAISGTMGLVQLAYQLKFITGGGGGKGGAGIKADTDAFERQLKAQQGK